MKALFSIVLGMVSFAATAAVSPSDVQTDFLALTYHSSNHQDLPYRLLRPLNYDSHKKYPLVVWLHGSGEWGTDNVQQLRNGIEQFDEPNVRAKYPAFVVAPQCPPNDRWSTMSHVIPPAKLRMSADPTRSAQSAYELISYLQSVYSVDSSRIYIVGLSMGGFGTWDFLARWPNLFAAGLPMSGGGDSTKAEKLIKKPIWDFHGNADTVVDVSFSQAVIGALRAAGGSPKYTEIQGWGHGPWLPIMQDPAVLAWLFRQ